MIRPLQSVFFFTDCSLEVKPGIIMLLLWNPFKVLDIKNKQKQHAGIIINAKCDISFVEIIKLDTKDFM